MACQSSLDVTVLFTTCTMSSRVVYRIYKLEPKLGEYNREGHVMMACATSWCSRILQQFKINYDIYLFIYCFLKSALKKWLGRGGMGGRGGWKKSSCKGKQKKFVQKGKQIKIPLKFRNKIPAQVYGRKKFMQAENPPPITFLMVLSLWFYFPISSIYRKLL